MSISVRAGDLESDRLLLIDVMSRNLPRCTDIHTFDWLYRDNPSGKAGVWLAVESKEKSVIGIAAAFPRQFYIGNNDAFAWVLGDFCLDAQYRSLGPALQLQRGCLGVLATGGGTFCYDFPSTGMIAIYKRLGIAVTDKMVRLARLLRIDRKVREFIKPRAAQRAVSAVGNTLLQLSPTKVPEDKFLKITLHHGPCGEEFSSLADELRGRLGTCIRRSAEYLNWRYVDNPLTRCDFITARREGVLRGYAVWTQAGEDALVLDLFGENDPTMVKGLLTNMAGRLTELGVMTLSVWLNESHPWLSWYSEMSFRVRDSVPMVCIPGSSVDLRRANWFLMQGDRDS